jgi:uncharacterized protein YdeI (YjbR/CyaY-like superfamily)
MELESHERRALDHLGVAATTALQLVLRIVVVIGAAGLLALVVPSLRSSGMALEPHDVQFFETPAELRAWLEANHDSATELWVGRYKKASGKASVTWPGIVDQVLCFGWIDGIAKGISDDAVAQRITPRTKTSTWSKINIAKVAQLEDAGLMTDAGRAAFAARREDRSGIYSHEQDEPATFTPAQEKAFKGNKAAWTAWEAMAPSYRKQAVHWVTSAKKEETRASRLATLIEDTANGDRVKPFRRPGT